MNKADQGRGYLGQTSWQLPETGPPDPSCSMKGSHWLSFTARAAPSWCCSTNNWVSTGASLLVAVPYKRHAMFALSTISSRISTGVRSGNGRVPLPGQRTRRRVRVEFFLWKRLSGYESSREQLVCDRRSLPRQVRRTKGPVSFQSRFYKTSPKVHLPPKLRRKVPSSIQVWQG